jgi:hypothetical protein
MSFARMFPQMLDEDLLKMQAQHGAVQEDFLPDEELVGTHDAAQAITEARMRSIARDSDEIQAGEEESIIDSNRKPIVPADEAVRSAEQVTPKVEKEKGWSPNFLAAAAAFTQNPALMQMLKERQEGPQRELEQSYKDAEAKRKAEKHKLEMEILSPLKAEEKRVGIDATKSKLQIEQEAVNPDSEYSKTMRESISQKLAAHAQVIEGRDAETAKLLRTAAQGIAANPKLSAMRAIEVAKQFGSIGQLAVSQSHAAAQEALSRAGLGETKRMHDATIDNMERDDERAADKDFNATIKGPQEKLNKEINDLEAALSQMGEIQALKGKVNTGPIANFIAKIGEKVDLTSDERNDLNALAARVFNKETKQLAGAAVSATEWARISPQIPQSSDDDRVFLSKLRRAMTETKNILDARRQEYQLKKNGQPVDSSKTAAKAVATAAGKTAPAAPPKAAPAPAAQTADPQQAKIEKARRALLSGTEAQKRGARAFLDSLGLK